MKSRIQIIDDNVALTTLLAKALAKFGYEPVVENNPLLAVNTVRHYLPDLILLDVMMPERDGGRVLADLRNDLSLRYIPVILLTAIAREAETLANMGGIQSTVLAKPVQLRELLQTIESHITATKSYHQLLDGPTQNVQFDSATHDLPDVAPEGNWGATRPTGGLLANSSISFAGHFPGRDDPGPLSTEGPEFSFPTRPDSEKPGGQVW